MISNFIFLVSIHLLFIIIFLLFYWRWRAQSIKYILKGLLLIVLSTIVVCSVFIICGGVKFIEPFIKWLFTGSNSAGVISYILVLMTMISFIGILYYVLEFGVNQLLKIIKKKLKNKK